MTLLALRALGLGDLLVAVPALRGLSAAFPGHRRLLALPGWLHPLAELIGGWDELVAVAGLDEPLPAGLPDIDVAVNLHGRGPSSSALLDQAHPRRRIGHAQPGWPGPAWVPPLPERQRWCRLLAWHGVAADAADIALDRPSAPAPEVGAVLVHPGAAYGAKRWPLPRFADVVAAHREHGHRVLITGGAQDRDLADQLAALAGIPASDVLAGRTGLPELAALVAAARLVISGDTGIAHLAFAYRTPSVTLFGPADPRQWGPPAGGPHLLLGGRRRRGDPFATDPDPALLAVTVPQVLRASGVLGVLPSTPDWNGPGLEMASDGAPAKGAVPARIPK